MIRTNFTLSPYTLRGLMGARYKTYLYSLKSFYISFSPYDSQKCKWSNIPRIVSSLIENSEGLTLPTLLQTISRFPP